MVRRKLGNLANFCPDSGVKRRVKTSAGVTLPVPSAGLGGSGVEETRAAGELSVSGAGVSRLVISLELEMIPRRF